jgi:hypothetical protein
VPEHVDAIIDGSDPANCIETMAPGEILEDMLLARVKHTALS